MITNLGFWWDSDMARSKKQMGEIFLEDMLQSYRKFNTILQFKNCAISEEISAYNIGKGLSSLGVIWWYVKFDCMVLTDSKCNWDLFPNDGMDIGSGCMSLLEAVYSPSWTDKETSGRWNNLLLFKAWADLMHSSKPQCSDLSSTSLYLMFSTESKINVQNQVL